MKATPRAHHRLLGRNYSQESSLCHYEEERRRNQPPNLLSDSV